DAHRRARRRARRQGVRRRPVDDRRLRARRALQRGAGVRHRPGAPPVRRRVAGAHLGARQHAARARGREGVVMEAGFTEAVEALRAPLRLHCYRMLGSAHDSDDMVQETMLRAWRARGSLDDPARVKPWLYRIATNACLDELRSRSRRALAPDIAAPVPGDSFPPAAPLEDA